MSRVKYTFGFSATDDWVPGESACWTDCPFSILLDLGSRCKCVVGKAVCPFLNEKYVFKFKEQQRGV